MTLAQDARKRKACGSGGLGLTSDNLDISLIQTRPFDESDRMMSQWHHFVARKLLFNPIQPNIQICISCYAKEGGVFWGGCQFLCINPTNYFLAVGITKSLLHRCMICNLSIRIVFHQKQVLQNPGCHSPCRILDQPDKGATSRGFVLFFNLFFAN